MKKSLISSVVLASMLLVWGAAFAAEGEGQKAVDVDEVIAKCEEKYTDQTVADENERNRLIDECVESQLKGHEGHGGSTD